MKWSLVTAGFLSGVPCVSDGCHLGELSWVPLSDRNVSLLGDVGSYHLGWCHVTNVGQSILGADE